MKERKSNRLQGYDYSTDNLYFVTSCVQNRICCFGEIVLTGRDPSINNGYIVPVGTGRDLSKQNGDLSKQNGDLSKQNGDLSKQNGDLSKQQRDLSKQNGEIASIWTGHDLSLQQPSYAHNDETSIPSSIPQMILNEYGKIAENQWYWLGEQYPYVGLHAFVVMPNHIHGIIEINRSRIISSEPIKIKSLSELIGAYKTTVSKQIHLSGFLEFQWQRSFHEHIIRDGKTFETISDYIINNPVNWGKDKFYNS